MSPSSQPSPAQTVAATVPNLRAKSVAIIGLPGEGKSVLARHILRHFSSQVVWDPLREHEEFDRYLPKHLQYSSEAVAEFNRFAARLVLPTKAEREASEREGREAMAQVKVLLIDEVNRIAPNRRPMPEALAVMNDLRRHWDLTLVMVTRRPADTATSLIELADYIFAFALAGKNDLDYLDALARGLRERVLALPQWGFMMLDRRRAMQEFPPLQL